MNDERWTEVESEDDWLFDYMMETFRSTTWEVPVMTFDENCVIFDNDEENKLVYTEKHREFCQLIDNLLSSHLSEIGVSKCNLLWRWSRLPTA